MKERPILFSGAMVRAILEGRKTQTRRVAKFKPLNKGYNLAFHAARAGFYSYLPEGGFVVRSRDGMGCWNDRTHPLFSPYGIPGDHLWVRETWFYEEHMHELTDGKPDLPGGKFSHRCIYRATNPEWCVHVGVGATGWRPSIHMPRWASRINLLVTSVRVERLQDISREDAIAEGINCPVALDSPCVQCGTCADSDTSWPIRAQANPISAFAELWDSINGKRRPSHISRRSAKDKPVDRYEAAHHGKSVLAPYSWDANPWVWVVEFEVVERVA